MSRARIAVAALGFSASALVGIATWEGYRGDAYDDGVGVQTIGFGSTHGVKKGDKTDPVRALIRLHQDADAFAQTVRSCAPVPMHQHEFDAFVSLAYNIGPTAFCGSTLAKKLNAGDYAGACAEIKRWNRAGGKVMGGLVKRRAAEYRQCMGVAP